MASAKHGNNGVASRKRHGGAKMAASSMVTCGGIENSGIVASARKCMAQEKKSENANGAQ